MRLRIFDARHLNSTGSERKMQRDDYENFSQKLVKKLGKTVTMDENAFFFERGSTGSKNGIRLGFDLIVTHCVRKFNGQIKNRMPLELRHPVFNLERIPYFSFYEFRRPFVLVFHGFTPFSRMGWSTSTYRALCFGENCW